MILSKEFYDHCCPTYQKIIDEFEKELIVLNDPTEVQAAVIKFSKRYLTPKKYWDRCFVYIGDRDSFDHYWDNWRALCREIAERAYCHLHIDKSWNELHFPNHCYLLNVYDEKYLKLIDNTNSSLVFAEQSIQHPHSDLENSFRVFEKITYQLPSEQLINRYEAMKELYSKIKAVEENVHEWFQLLLEVDDVDFVKDNVEFRLGKNYFDVELWKLYFGFLKEHGQYKLLLLTYSKYCRFFLDDREILDEYKNDMIRYGPAYLPWDNLFEFEVKMEEAEEEEENLELEEALPLDKRLCSTFFDTYQRQNFAFLGPLMLYVLENANHRVLRKLFSSCKYFFAKKSTPICYRLDDDETETIFNGEWLSLHDEANLDLFVKNIYVTGAVCFGIFGDGDISNIIPRMYRCEAKFIKLWSQKISFNDLKFLIQHGCVIDLDLTACEIFDDNDEYVDLEEIMKYLPNIKDLCLPSVKVNANTGHALSQLTFTAKFSSFQLDRIYGEPFDGHKFLKYCFANRGDKCRMSLSFNDEFNADFVKEFSKIMYVFRGKTSVRVRTLGH